ncbi:PHP domain-containing protein [Nanoarchaeota archaeon]
MEIINPENTDYHMHSFNYSDGMNTVEEIVIYAGKIGLETIAITDHSQFVIDKQGYGKKCSRTLLRRWGNQHNDVKVIFGVEADIKDKYGDVCTDILGEEPEFIILSAHKDYIDCKDECINQAYKVALKKYHDKIKFVAHPCIKAYSKHLDIDALVKQLNEYKIPAEINGANLLNNKTDIDMLIRMCSKIDRVYVNSDAHTLKEMKYARQEAYKFLGENNFFRGK